MQRREESKRDRETEAFAFRTQPTVFGVLILSPPLLRFLPMFTLGLAMTLRPDAYEKYKLAHDQLWPELARGMHENQVDMAVYRDGHRLFLFATAPSKEHWERSRQDPVLARWDAQMAQLLETDAKGNIAFTALPKAFGFGEFK